MLTRRMTEMFLTSLHASSSDQDTASGILSHLVFVFFAGFLSVVAYPSACHSPCREHVQVICSHISPPWLHHSTMLLAASFFVNYRRLYYEGLPVEII